MPLTSSMPVFTFHALDHQRSPISFPPHLFQRGMARLSAHGHRTLSLEQAVEHVQAGKPFPIRACVMTFDDGYRSVYEEAFPVLRNFNMTATVFLTVGSTGEPEERLPPLNGRVMLSWQEIREMRRYGIAFGAHTLSHPDLSTLSGSKVEKEIVGSKEIIERALGVPVSSFAYPFGRYDETSQQIARAHFICACSDRLGLIDRRSDPYALERIDAYYLNNEKLFGLVETGLFPWYILGRRIPRQIKRTIQHRRSQ
jgi:peptidoglycan/xylan/chitin deacetylase (PgdA/CDA1 family)